MMTFGFVLFKIFVTDSLSLFVFLLLTCNDGSWYPCLSLKALWHSSRNSKKMSNERKPTPASNRTKPGVKVASIGSRVTSTSDWPVLISGQKTKEKEKEKEK